MINVFLVLLFACGAVWLKLSCLCCYVCLFAVFGGFVAVCLLYVCCTCVFGLNMCLFSVFLAVYSLFVCLVFVFGPCFVFVVWGLLYVCCRFFVVWALLCAVLDCVVFVCRCAIFVFV